MSNSIMARNLGLATRGRSMLNPGGQTAEASKSAAMGDTVDATAARMHDAWMPDTSEKYRQLIDCITHPPTTATPRPECAAPLQFLASHCRYYTPTPGGPTSIICEPLREGEPWLDVATWMTRNWDRMTPGYAPSMPDRTALSVPGTGTTPPEGSQPIVLPTAAAETCSTDLTSFLAQNPQHAQPAPFLISKEGETAFEAAHPACRQDPTMPWNIAPALTQDTTTTTQTLPVNTPTAAEAEAVRVRANIECAAWSTMLPQGKIDALVPLFRIPGTTDQTFAISEARRYIPVIDQNCVAAAASRRNMFIGATVLAVAIAGGGVWAYRKYSKKNRGAGSRGK